MHLSYGTVRESPRQVIYSVRVYDAILELHEVDDVVARMRERLAHRGEPSAEIVVVQGDAKDAAPVRFALFRESCTQCHV